MSGEIVQIPVLGSSYETVGEVGFDVPPASGVTVRVDQAAGSVGLVLSDDREVYAAVVLSWPAAGRLASYLAEAFHRASLEADEQPTTGGGQWG